MLCHKYQGVSPVDVGSIGGAWVACGAGVYWRTVLSKRGEILWAWTFIIPLPYITGISARRRTFVLGHALPLCSVALNYKAAWKKKGRDPFPVRFRCGSRSYAGREAHTPRFMFFLYLRKALLLYTGARRYMGKRAEGIRMERVVFRGPRQGHTTL